ncbi:hypothetical protein GGS21DRAFT_329278 [Xylaria nigripes]|nr:hypothetical protein GGS21DRAFT_329278 [Xylaria nigripes]
MASLWIVYSSSSAIFLIKIATESTCMYKMLIVNACVIRYGDDIICTTKRFLTNMRPKAVCWYLPGSLASIFFSLSVRREARVQILLRAYIPPFPHSDPSNPGWTIDRTPIGHSNLCHSCTGMCCILSFNFLTPVCSFYCVPIRSFRLPRFAESSGHTHSLLQQLAYGLNMTVFRLAYNPIYHQRIMMAISDIAVLVHTTYLGTNYLTWNRRASMPVEVALSS